MKIKIKYIFKLTLTLVTSIMLLISLPSVLFASNGVNRLGLKDNEEVEVIVEFTSPSLLELNAKAEYLYPFDYEEKLLKEQNAILDEIDIEAHFNYTHIINAAAIKATKEEISKLEQLKGVENVYISQTYQLHEVDDYVKTSVYLDEMMEITSSIENGYTGDGVLVAVLDSGIALKHEAFNNTKYVLNPALTQEDVSNLSINENASYYNEKIPFYCDYTGSSSDFSEFSDHGSHVSGIIAGYAENEDGTVKFSGIAPGAQICSMRVLSDIGGGSDAIVFAALEDAYKLGVDIINISFGSDSSFRLGGDLSNEYKEIFDNLETAGIAVVCSAGNLSSMAEKTPRYVLDENCVDYGTLSFPAIYPGNIGVGSIENNQLYSAIISIDGVEYSYSNTKDCPEDLDFLNVFNGKSVDILYFNNYGKKEDYVGVDVEGKIVAVNRGGLSFTDKCQYAAEAGAIGLIIINGESESMGNLVINNQSIPTIIVENGFSKHLPKNDYNVSFSYGMITIEGERELSYFSAVGVTPDLEIGLDILGVGRYIYSVDYETTDGYVIHSGTSMAVPTIAGTYALLYQVVKESEEYKDKSKLDITNYIEDVTQSTATIIKDEFGNVYSPRFQGAGFIDFDKASIAKAYISTPLVCLGYDVNTSGNISMEYELINNSNVDINYVAKVLAITDEFMQITPTNYKNKVIPHVLDESLYSYDIYVDGVLISDDEQILLPANGKIVVKVALSLSEEIKTQLSAAFPYGYFLDGFVQFYDVNDMSESAIHGGYVSFVGDWLAGPVVEPLTQIDVMNWIDSIGGSIEELLQYFAAGHLDANYNYTKILVGNNENYIGENPLSDGNYIQPFADRNAISASFSDADKVIYDSLTLIPSLLRSCKSIRYEVTNSETKEVYVSETQNYVRKEVPLDYYVYFGFTDFTFTPVYTTSNELGQITEHYIPSGTDVTISIYTLIDHKNATERLEFQYNVTIDYTAPELYYDYDATTKLLTVKCTDSEYLAGIILEEVDESLNIGEKVDSRIFADETPGLEHTEVFDLSGYSGEYISITVSDYASNMETLVLSLGDRSVSNIESTITFDNSLNVELMNTPYIYQEVEFSVTPKKEYCFNESFEILVNGQKVDPVSNKDGIYLYKITILEKDLVITTNGVITHTFVDTITKHSTCTESGTCVTTCSNCGVIQSTTSMDPLGHSPGEYEVTKEPTCVDSGLRVIKCTQCHIILEEELIPQKGHTLGKEATAFSPAICKECGEEYGTPNSNSLLIISLVLSSVAIISVITVGIVIFVKKKKRV